MLGNRIRCLQRAGRLITPAAIVLWAFVASPLAGQQAAVRGVRATQAAHPSHYEPSHFPKRAAMYYESIWGVDELSVKAAESGQLIRFSYRILDPAKAHLFNDIKVDAFLISPAKRVKLVVPSLEKVGMLRQRNTPEPGKRYWMAFSNPHLTVKRGDRVDVVIGQFHADGLVIE